MYLDNRATWLFLQFDMQHSDRHEDCIYIAPEDTVIYKTPHATLWTSQGYVRSEKKQKPCHLPTRRCTSSPERPLLEIGASLKPTKNMMNHANEKMKGHEFPYL